MINITLDELLNSKNIKKDILRNTQILEVANYTSKDDNNKNIVMDFGDMEGKNNGAQIMTLIKGDVDNLGLIMSSGLVGNKDDDPENEGSKDLTGISRTTTLSNHLKYFFSFSLNGFLKDWEGGKILDDKEKKIFADAYLSTEEGKNHFAEYIKDRKVYTVFAGGDDLMLICPQSSALKLVNTLNKTFNDFVCENHEVHISYSLTNFKHNTPIRIVADMAEESQEKIKSEFKSKFSSDKKDVFYAENNKAGIRLFNTNVKNERMKKIIEQQLILQNGVINNQLTMGIIRNLHHFSKMMQRYRKDDDTKELLWYPLLTYMINRKVKHQGNYPTKELEIFFRNIFKISNSQGEIKDQDTLYPLICNTIYSLRK